MTLLLALLSTAHADPADAVEPGFSAGSYGRVQASSDLAGGNGDVVDVTSHVPRLGLDPYMELDLAWRAQTADGATFDAVITPAISGELFHYTGNFGQAITLRNFYAEAAHFLKVPLSVWAGSRMYRGDDLYLLDFWPLDNLNTFGGGVAWRPAKTEIALHAGVNRLLADDWQYQALDVEAPDSVTGEEVVILDRQRMITSLKASREVPVGDLTFRAKVYGELHTLPAGTRMVADPFQALQKEQLPADQGSLVGLQLSLWGWAPQSFVHVWLRRSTGLAAFGELSVPQDGLDLDLRAANARNWLAATAMNTELGPVGVMAGGYVSYAVDADGQTVDFDDRWETVGVLRPTVYVNDHVALSAEVDHEHVRPNGLNPRDDEWDKPDVTKISFLPGIQTSKGGFSRPRIQLVYTATFLDDDARAFFSPYDTRVKGGVQQYVGLGAEWWINSQRTITPD